MAVRVLMKGTEAIAEAAIRAGCRHYFGYPITPPDGDRRIHGKEDAQDRRCVPPGGK